MCSELQDESPRMCLQNQRLVKIAAGHAAAAAGILIRGAKRSNSGASAFDEPRSADYHSDGIGHMRQFIYGVILGVAAMYCYARLDPLKVFAYLNSATQSAVESTHGYGGTKK